MRLIGLVVAALVIVLGFRLITVAIQTAVRSKVLTRQGIRYEWHAVDPSEAFKRAFRDGFMGVLLMVLGIFMLY